MRARFRQLLAAALLACFSVYLVPKEFVHSLYGHEDTKHEKSAEAKDAIGKAHLHCAFLTYEASLFTVTSTADCPQSAERAFAFTSLPAAQFVIPFSARPSLRGPPIA